MHRGKRGRTVVAICEKVGNRAATLQRILENSETEKARTRLKPGTEIAFGLPVTGSLRTLRLGGGELATVALPRALHGPAGLSVAAGAVWIAETDAHAVLRYDIATGELSHVPIDE